MATRKHPQPQQQPDNPTLDTPCTVQTLQNWLKDLHPLFPGSSNALMIQTDGNKIEAILVE